MTVCVFRSYNFKTKIVIFITFESDVRYMTTDSIITINI